MTDTNDTPNIDTTPATVERIATTIADGEAAGEDARRAAARICAGNAAALRTRGDEPEGRDG